MNMFSFRCKACRRKFEAKMPMDSYECCGKPMGMVPFVASAAHIFKAYHCLASNRVISSAKQEAVINKREGVRNLGDCTDMRKRMKAIRENREEIIADRYKPMGVKYKKGSKVKFDDVKNTFIPSHR